MFSNALIVFFAASMAVAAPLRQLAPRGYIQDADLLQPYADYNNRYVALNCVNKHNTPFYDQCCHPLLKDEPLSALPAQCIASPSATSSAAASGQTLAPGGDDNDDDDCDDESSSVAPTSSSAAPASSVVPTTTIVPGNVEHSHSAAPTTSAAPTSSPVPTTTVVPTTHVVPTTSDKPTPTPKPSTTSTKAPAATTAASNTGSSANVGGFATFFYQGGNPGACGAYHADSDLIVAIDEQRYGDSSKKSDLCGKKVQITNTNNGKSVTATIADDCPSCRNNNSIDLSVGTFLQIATEAEGEVPISWVFV